MCARLCDTFYLKVQSDFKKRFFSAKVWPGSKHSHCSNVEMRFKAQHILFKRKASDDRTESVRPKSTEAFVYLEGTVSKLNATQR